jgi:hypothetical protein
MADDSISTASNEVLEHEVTELAGQIAAATCRFLLLVGELDRRESWRECWGCKSMAHWLSWRCSLSRAAAFEHVRVARGLRDLPLTARSFGRGELSYSKVRAITRVATAESEADLVELARTATAAQLDRIVRASVVAMSDPVKRQQLTELYLRVDDAGMGTVRARLPIDLHAIVEQAIDKALPPKESPAGDGDPREDEERVTPMAERRAIALAKICESYLAHGDAARTPATRNNAVVHVEVDPSGVVAGETEQGTPVHPDTCRRLLCDAAVQGMLGDLDQPLGCGRSTRTISRKLRRALKRRSGSGCQWKGCTEHTYVEAHHVWHWEHGGPTELWNLVNLCWHHHHLVHEGGWQLKHDGRGGVRCYRPDRTELLDPIPTMPSDRLDLEIEPEAIVPGWRGEAFDLSACVDSVRVATGRWFDSP